MKKNVIVLTLATLALAAAPNAFAGLGKSLVHGVAIGAGATVGHRLANAAMGGTAAEKRAKEKEEARKIAAAGPVAIQGAPNTVAVPAH